MWWIVAGVALGALAGGYAGAVGGAVVGGFAWMIAYGIKLRSQSGPKPAHRVAHASRPDDLEQRLDSIEARLARLETDLATLAGKPARTEPPEAAPEPLPFETIRELPPDALMRPLPQPLPPVEAPPPITPAPLTETPPPLAADRLEELSEVLRRAETLRPDSESISPAQPAEDLAPAPQIAEPGAKHPAWWERLASGNIVAKVGAVVLFFGVAFLLKYAYDRAVFPPEARLAAVAFAGFALIGIGWKLLATRRLYGLILQGAGMGVLYLDVYFALRWFGLVSPAAAFALFALLGAATVLLAVLRDARPLAVLGLIGAFAAPPLASTGAGSHVALFSYFLLLNLLVLAISLRRSWRELNLVGFVFTFVVGGLWGVRYYRPEHFVTVEPFLLAFFAIYLAIPILFARRQPPELRGVVDATLVFGTPLFVAVAQAALVRDLPYGLAWSAAGGAVIYAALAVATFRDAAMRVLAETYVALATALATLAIFFAFDAYPTFAFWTLEGCAILWVGLRQRRILAQAFGLALQFVAAIYFLNQWHRLAPAYPFWNELVIGCGIVAVAGMLSGWLLHRHAGAGDPLRPAGGALALWALAWWFGGGLYGLHHALTATTLPAGALVLAAATFAAIEAAGARLGWVAPREAAALHLLFLAGGAAAQAQLPDAALPQPLAGYGWIAWPLSFASYFWVLHRHALDGIDVLDRIRYAAGWFVMLALATWVGAWFLAEARFELALAWGAAGIAVAWLRWHLRERSLERPRPLSGWVVAWALVWWLAGGAGWIDRDTPLAWQAAALLLLAAGTAVWFEAVGSALGWRAARRAQIVLPLAMLVMTGGYAFMRTHPLADGGWLGWPIAFATLYMLLRRQDGADATVLPRLQHLAGAWLAVGLLTWEGLWQTSEHVLGSGWRAAAWVAPAALALVVSSRLSSTPLWPFARYRDTYAGGIALPLAAAALLWSVAASPLASGDPRPFAYLPLLNPVDVAQGLVLAGLWLFARFVAAPGRPDIARVVPVALGALGFLWLNAILLRTVHHYAGVPFALVALLDSVLTQSALSIVWTVTALALMLVATRHGLRTFWLAGAVLLAVVVVKLFVNDLGNTGTIARIVSFIGVGVLLLAIGYLAPVPPARREAD
jgi:uncharacterized membrane protein